MGWDERTGLESDRSGFLCAALLCLPSWLAGWPLSMRRPTGRLFMRTKSAARLSKLARAACRLRRLRCAAAAAELPAYKARASNELGDGGGGNQRSACASLCRLRCSPISVSAGGLCLSVASAASTSCFMRHMSSSCRPRIRCCNIQLECEPRIVSLPVRRLAGWLAEVRRLSRDDRDDNVLLSFEQLT